LKQVGCLNSYQKLKLVENTEKAFLDLSEPISNFLFMFRNNHKLMLNFLDCVNKENEDDIINLISHFFYENIISYDNDQEELIIICYHLLKKEIESINTPNVNNFLDYSLIGKIIKNLTKKLDFKNFATIAFSDFILKMETSNDSVIELDIYKLNENIRFKMDKVKEIKKTNHDYNPKHTLTDKIRKTTLNHKKSMQNIKNNNGNNNNFNSTYNTEDFYSVINTHNSNGNNYIDINDINVDDELIINNDYKIELTEEELMRMYEDENDYNMKQFCKNNFIYFIVLKLILKTEDDKHIFTNERLINNINKYEFKHEIVPLYKENFEKLKSNVDAILNNILHNEKVIPYIIKCLCKMTSVLLQKRVTNIN
jgi:hypothetical protein